MTSLKGSVYFAPGIKFSDLDIYGDQFPDQYGRRIKGLYLDPAMVLIESKHAFSAGLLIVCCVDAIAKYQLLDIEKNKYKVGKRFKIWCQMNLPSFKNDQYAKCFYEHFRNGLVHESRIKEGGSFSFDIDKVVSENQLSIDIQPWLLHKEVDQAVSIFIESIKKDKYKCNLFSHVIQSEFKQELK